MSSKRVRNLFHKFGRAKSQSTTDLSEWSKSDEKLMKAVEANDAKKVSSILSKKAMVPSKLGPRGHSIFHVACALGNDQIVELLLKETDDVNDLTIQGNTCLQLAAAKGHQQVVQRLIQNSAEVDMRDSNDMTALHHACAGVHYGVVHALLQGGSDPRCMEMGGKTSLFYAAHRGDIGICKLLVDKGADVNAGDKMQITPLMVAAKEGNREVCEFLLKRGANPNTPDREGHLALYYAMAASHPELKEVFAKAPTHASWDLNNTEAGADRQEEGEGESTLVASEASSPPQHDTVITFTRDTSPPEQRSADTVRSLASSDAETMSQSEDEKPSRTRTSDPGLSSSQISPRGKDTQAYKELEAEHEQLSDEYHTLSIENLRLRDKLEFLQQRMNSKHEQGNGAKAMSKEAQKEIRNLKNILEEEKERCKELESRLAAMSADGAEASTDPDNWHDSDEEELFKSQGKKTKEGKEVSDKEMVALLRSQILTLRQENDQLRSSSQAVASGQQDSNQQKSEDGQDKTDSGSGLTKEASSQLEAENQNLKAEVLKLRESATSQELNGALGQEELVQTNSQLQSEVQSLRSTVQALEGDKTALQTKLTALEEEKAAMPSDKVAVLNSAKVMEEVQFDEEGFVDGQDLTKEEFLQAQNDQLKMQCSLLTDELSKLRGTFDALLKAGDNLQNDYDQLQAEKDRLHDQLEVMAREKEEVVKENEFLLSDGNSLHEDLKKLVQELEKMQEKYRKVCAEKEQLQHQHNAVNIAGKVGEVARLLEEREKLQGRLSEAEETVGRLTHNQAILLEEVQSLQDSNATLTSERDSLQAEAEDIEALVTQNETMTQEFAQMELDFSELLKEKERLEADLQKAQEGIIPAEASTTTPPDSEALAEERDLLAAERVQLELTIQELSRENASLEEETVSLRAQLAESGGDSSAVSSGPSEERLLQLTKENAELEEELANAHESISALEAQVEDLSLGKGEDSEVEALKTGISQLETTVAELSRENADLEEELTNIRTQFSLSQGQLEDSSTSSSTSLVAKLKGEKQELESRVEQLQKRLAESVVNGETERSYSLTLNNNLKGEEERLLHSLSELETENKQLKGERDSVLKQLASLQSGSGGQAMKGVNGVMEDSDAEDGNGALGSKRSRDTERIAQLMEQATRLQQELAELEQIHADTVSTYRTHLLSAVQGHMDPEVKEALHSIIEMRSMEQFC